MIRRIIQAPAFIPSLALLGYWLLLCLFAIHLNHDFYKRFAPAYDSMSYYCDLIDLWSVMGSRGWAAGWWMALHGGQHGTRGLSLLIACLYSSFPLHRSIGVWIQAPWVLGLLFSVFYYARLVLKACPWTATLLAIPFCSISAVFFANGGLGDYRMDLNLYFLFGCSTCWFLIALEKEQRVYWILAGLFTGLTALARITSPAYFVITFVPIIVVHLFLYRKWRNIFYGIAIVGAIMLILSGWYYYTNYTEIYHYYILSNGDAHANLPLFQSLYHFNLSYLCLGTPMLLTAVAMLLISLPSYRSFSSSLARWRWEPLVVGLAPSGLMAINGVGYNPFVAMPSVIGYILFIYSLRLDWMTIQRWQNMALTIILSVGVAYSWYLGIGEEDDPNIGYHRSAIDHILDLVERDASSNNYPVISFYMISEGSFDTVTLKNIVFFDRHYGKRGNNSVSNRLVYSFPYIVPIYVVDWSEIPGKTIDEKVDALTKGAEALSYAIVPDAETALRFSTDKTPYHYFANTQAMALRQRLLGSGKWRRISDAILVNSNESYELYKNISLNR